MTFFDATLSEASQNALILSLRICIGIPSALNRCVPVSTYLTYRSQAHHQARLCGTQHLNAELGLTSNPERGNT